MSFRVVVDAERGVLARLLLVTERRGFRIQRLTAVPRERVFEVHLEVESERDPRLLQRMLERLEDVRSVSWTAPTP